MPARQTHAFAPHSPGPAQAKPAVRPSAPTPTTTTSVGVPRFAAVPRPPSAVTQPEAAQGPTAVHDVLRSPGRPLEFTTRRAMEARLGHDFGAVRVHTDARAAESARAVGAQAFTVNQHVVFAAGQFAPATADGDYLLAHELVHTLQQPSTHAVTPDALQLAAPGDTTETEAHRLALPARTDATPVRVTPTRRHIARQPVPGMGGVLQPRQRLELAKEFLRRMPGGPAMLNGLVEHQVVIELRSATGASSLYRIENPMKQTGKLAWSRDENDWELVDLAKSSGEGKSPRIVLDENQTAGDLALNLFRSRQQARWAAGDPQTLAASVRADDQATARAEYAKGMTENVVSRNFEQLQLKLALQAEGASVSTPLLLESEYRLAYNQAFAAGMSQHGSAKRAASDATSAAYRTIKDAVESGKVRSHTQEKYRDHFAQAWERERAAWVQREPEKAAAGQVRHETATMIKALVALTNKVDPTSADAENVIGRIDAFARNYGGATRVVFMFDARVGLARLLGPFGYRAVAGTNIGGLMQQRLDYALANFRALQPDQRRRLLQQPSLAAEYGIRTEPTADELSAEGRLVAIRKLPDGSLHTGTLDEFREASEVNRINHALGQLQAIRQSGPGSLVGRIVGGEKGAAYGAGADAFLAIRGAVKARATVRAQIRTGTNLPRTTGVGPGGRGSSAPLEPIGHRAPAPRREPMPAPRPAHVSDADVVATHIHRPASLVVQEPAVHQARWQKLGGEGVAPPAYRRTGQEIFVSSESWLFAPPTSKRIQPVSPGAPAAAPPPTPAVQPPAPKPPSTGGQIDIGMADTGQAPAPPPVAVKQIKIQPAGGKIVSADAKTAPPGSGDHPPPGVLAGGKRAEEGTVPPPQAISAELVRQIRAKPMPANVKTKDKGKGSGVVYSLDADTHQRIWEYYLGQGNAPSAFIFDNQVYLNPAHWPRH
jgi:hypothetical protein